MDQTTRQELGVLIVAIAIGVGLTALLSSIGAPFWGALGFGLLLNAVVFFGAAP